MEPSFTRRDGLFFPFTILDSFESPDRQRRVLVMNAATYHAPEKALVNEQPAPKKFGAQQGLILTALVGVAALIYVQFGSELTLESLASRESALRSFQAEYSILVFFIAFAVYVVITGLSLPGAAVLTLVYGWFFGFLPALVLVSFASTTGATLAFLSSRYLLGSWVQERFASQLKTFNDELEKDGAFYLLTLRLIPAVPFFVINLVMGLTKLPTRTFWWVSQIGMLAGTAVYVYAGSSVPNLQTLADEGVGAVFSRQQLLQFTIAFGLLGIFPLVTRKAVAFWKTK